MKAVGKFYGHSVHFTYSHFVYFMSTWYILWPFGIFYGHLVYFMVILVYFSRFGTYVVPRKIWQPCFRADDFFPERFQ
jgi:hypothetical protein